MEAQETESPAISEQCSTACQPLNPTPVTTEAAECTKNVADTSANNVTGVTDDNALTLVAKSCEDTNKARDDYLNIAIKEELLSSDEDELFIFEGGTYTDIKSEELVLKDEVAERRNFECPQCHQTFYLEYLYLYHMMCHEGVKPKTCTLCKYRCNKRIRMLAHLCRHTGEKKKLCKICGEYYYPWQDFEHFQNCPKPKPYNCSLCEYSTSNKNNFLKHHRLHTGERPYKCRRCGSGFIDTVTQRKHFKTHLKEKLYQCHICHKRFKLPQNRERHVLSFSGRKCPKCDYVCINCEDYYWHIKHFHSQSKLKSKLDFYFKELARYSRSMQQTFSLSPQLPVEEKFFVQQLPVEQQFPVEEQLPTEPEIVYNLPQNIKYEYVVEADSLRAVIYVNLG